MLAGLTNTLSNYFLQPAGLLALLGLLPLLIFYLIQKKPEEQLMPSMMFFMRDEKSGKARQAFRTLLRNWLLLLHILLIAGLAAAVANPFLNTPERPENAVIVLDHSASMADEMDQARSFAKSNLGTENTLITVGDEIKIPVERGSSGEVESRINSLESKAVKTDVASAIELASDYEGTIIVASDMDQTESQKSAEEIVEVLRNSGRTVKVMAASEANAWGIIGVEPGETNSTVEVKNFLDSTQTIAVTTDSASKEIELKPDEVQAVTFETSSGKNVFRLEEDNFELDNTAYISIPEEKQFEVAFISEEENPYFEKAIELISFTSITTYNPPVNQEIEADIYVLGDTSRVLSDTVENIEQNVRSGSSLIVFGHPDVFNLDMDSLPVERTGDAQEQNVLIQRPQKATIKTDVIPVNITRGESFTSPDDAMVKADYGDGEVFFYNINDEDFHFNFIYPVFWKAVMQDLVEKPSINDLNLQTGSELTSGSIETPSGETRSGTVKLDETGFYTTENGVYAVNLADEDESYAEELGIETSSDELSMEKQDVQNLAALILAFVLLGELGYLARLGDF